MNRPDPRGAGLDDERAVAVVRGLVMDMVEAAGTGHPGTAMSLAPIMHVLYSEVLRHDPADPDWPDRDRFVLSSGHTAAVLYAVLHLAGYGLSLAELRTFRTFGSRVPGHPERSTTPGVDATTGALGQGFANAVGMALAERILRAHFGDELCDHWTYVVMGDGDLQEGISHEAAALAGHWGLGRLVAIYNENGVTLDGATSLSMSEDVATRFAAYGWRVDRLGDVADDLAALRAGLAAARADADAPVLLILRTRLAYPAPAMTGDHRSHGEPLGPDEVRATKLAMGLSLDEDFQVPTDVLDGYRQAMRRNRSRRDMWDQRMREHPRRGVFEGWLRYTVPEDGHHHLFDVNPSEVISPRNASQHCVTRLASVLPQLVAGSADITAGTATLLPGETDNTQACPRGRQLRFGIREHGMVGVMTGMALHGGMLPLGGTYLAFSDYLRPALRLAGLQGAHLVLSLTHDGFDCAEDGPTHHAPEHIAALRTIPGIRVLRPGDAGEVVQAWELALTANRPVALVLSREPVGTLGHRPSGTVARGAYVIGAEDDPEVVLIGTGVEIHLCLATAELLREHGAKARVVSAPCWELFLEQSPEYQAAVLPPGVLAVVAEAGIPFGWAGRAEPVASISELRDSGPASILNAHAGLTPLDMAAAVLEQFGRASTAVPAHD